MTGVLTDSKLHRSFKMFAFVCVTVTYNPEGAPPCSLVEHFRGCFIPFSQKTFLKVIHVVLSQNISKGPPCPHCSPTNILDCVSCCPLTEHLCRQFMWLSHRTFLIVLQVVLSQNISKLYFMLFSQRTLLIVLHVVLSHNIFDCTSSCSLIEHFWLYFMLFSHTTFLIVLHAVLSHNIFDCISRCSLTEHF